jgi:hypothetical protein
MHSGVGAMGRPSIPLTHQVWKIADVINMRVRQDHRINGLRIEGEILIPSVGFFATPLVKPAIE